MKNNVIILAGFWLLAFLILPLSLPHSAVAGKPALKIGVNLDTTGYAAWLGEPELRAVQLYAEQVNASGGIDGHPLELVIYDNQSNPEKASTNAKKMIQRDKVSAMIATSITATSNAAKPVAQAEKTTMYSLSGSFEPNYPDSFSFAGFVHTTGMVETIYDYFAKKGIKRVALLCANDSTGQTWFEVTTREAKKYGIQIASERFNVNDMDVTPQLARLKAINPQALIVGVSGKPNAVVAKNFNQMGFKIPYVTGHGNISDSFLKLMEGNEPDNLLLPGAYFVVWQELNNSYPQKKIMKEFSDAYQKKFSKMPDIYAVVAYDAIRVLVEALKRAKVRGPEDSEKVHSEIEKIKNFPAVYGGTYSFSKDDHRGLQKADAVMLQVKGGKFRLAR
ncbi:MAG: ABC transporter substrate-binding protein [Desulfuromonadaceae bacterium]|nr:ABC transporter substrate-binding protein [Desulfuromonadaceae bacterium]